MNSSEVKDKQFLLVNKAAVYITKIFRLLGIDDSGSAYAFISKTGGDDELLPEALDAFCSLREVVRAGCRAKVSNEELAKMASDAREGPLAALRTKASKQQQASLPSVLDAFDQWARSVGEAASRGDAPSAYLQLCDNVRDYVLPDLGVRLEDKPEGFVWKLDDADVLRREREEKAKAASDAARKKVENKLTKAQADLEKMKLAMVSPADVFAAQKDKYSQFDASGVPTHNAAGEELNKSARKGVEKEFKRREGEHAKYKDALAKNPDFMAALQADIDAMIKQIALLS